MVKENEDGVVVMDNCNTTIVNTNVKENRHDKEKREVTMANRKRAGECHMEKHDT